MLTGFLSDDDSEAYGRPVGVAIDKQGSLLVADDVGNVIWRVAPAPEHGGTQPPLVCPVGGGSLLLCWPR